jgi:hypothetical protein
VWVPMSLRTLTLPTPVPTYAHGGDPTPRHPANFSGYPTPDRTVIANLTEP